MARIPRGFSSTLACLIVAGSVSGDVVFDQIGPDDGSTLNDNYVVSQHFQPPLPSTWDIAAVDGFSLATDSTLSGIDFVLHGNGSFGGPPVVAGYEVNIYSDLEAAASNLIGDILSANVVATADTGWSGVGSLMQATLDATLSAGSYYLSVMMTLTEPGIPNPGIATTDLGDGASWMVSPGGKYPFSPYMSLSTNLGYRLHGSDVPSPGAIALLALATLMPRRRRRLP